jgi:hypothetical protein
MVSMLTSSVVDGGFGVITIVPFDNLYRRAYFVMHTFLVIVLTHWNNSSRIDMLPHSDTLAWFRANQTLHFSLPSPSLILLFVINRIGGVMVSMLTSSVVDGGFESWSGQTKDYEIGICC